MDKDLPILVDLLNEEYQSSYEFIPYNEEKLRSWIQTRKLEILMAVENGKILGSVAYNDGYWGEEIDWLAVTKCPDKRAIEDKLVEEAEKYVKGETVFTAVDSESPRINEWIQRGYKMEGGLCHMLARLDGLKPLPKVPEGIVLRSLRPNEENELVEAVNAGFGWERIKHGVIQKWKSEYPSFNEEWIHIAESNGKIVSVVVSKLDVEYNQFFKGKRGYLGPATTLPEYRGKNLASALTCKAMNFLYEKGMDCVALYTSEQNIPSMTLLSRLGFVVGHNWKFMRKKICSKL